jgi:hypothetical protein
MAEFIDDNRDELEGRAHLHHLGGGPVNVLRIHKASSISKGVA